MRPMAARARLLAPGHPLAGASVIVTRPAATAGALRRRVRALGGTPIGLPAIGLRASADAATLEARFVAIVKKPDAVA